MRKAIWYTTQITVITVLMVNSFGVAGLLVPALGMAYDLGRATRD